MAAATMEQLNARIVTAKAAYETLTIEIIIVPDSENPSHTNERGL